MGYRRSREVHVGREIIEQKLLAAMNDESKVLIVLGKDDLDWLIMGMESLPAEKDPTGHARGLKEDMQELRKTFEGE